MPGKKYQELAKKVENEKLYPVGEAIVLAQAVSTSKFDGSIEAHIKLNVNPEQSDQMVRGTVVLPNGSGKTRRVAVITSDAKLKDATAADVKGSADLIAEIEKGKTDFDVLIASPDMMPAMAKLGKVLGPKGLMPNPKTGTVTDKIAQAIDEFKGGKQEFRMDKYGIVHSVIGKVSFEPEKLQANLKALTDALSKAKPDVVKSAFLKSLTLAPTMGPGVKVDLKSL